MLKLFLRAVGIITISLALTAFQSSEEASEETTNEEVAKPEIDPGVAQAAAEAAAEGLPDYIRAALVHPDRPAKDKNRDTNRKPGKVIEFIGIEPDDRVLDIWAAGGFYTEILARLVNDDGQIIAHNNFKYAGYSRDEIDERFGAMQHPKVIHYVTEMEHLGLIENTIDVAICIACYHDIYLQQDPNHPPDAFWPYVDAPVFLAEVYNALKPGGVFGLVDHQALEGSGQIAGKNVHRIHDDLVRAELETAGFEYVASADFLRNPEDDLTVQIHFSEFRGRTDRWVMKFKKPD